MKYVTFEYDGKRRAGVLTDSGIIDVQQAQRQKMADVSLADDLGVWIDEGDAYLEDVARIVAWAKDKKDGNFFLDPEHVKLLAPIPRPRKNIFCIGKNYADHAKELGSAADIPEYPMVFSKTTTTVVGPGKTVFLNRDVTDSLDYEGELAVVIGKKGKGIAKDDAYDYVFGYTMINDVTARDLQERHKQFLLGKSLDTSCPMGPCIVHKDEIGDPHNLNIETKVNGEVRQTSNTSKLIFDIPTLIATISQGTTLEPGDIIATGTPAGVGKGMNPPQYLQTSDVMEVTVEGIGTLKNTVIDEM